MSSKRTLNIASSSALLPAAAINPIGMGRSSPSITNMSPRVASRTRCGARSRKRRSMRSTYVPGGSVMCESAEMIAVMSSPELAVLAWRKLARVHGLLEELLGIVLPELAHVRVREDHGVLQLAPHALDLAEVDVLGRVAVGVHLDRPARRISHFHRA